MLDRWSGWVSLKELYLADDLADYLVDQSFLSLADSPFGENDLADACNIPSTKAMRRCWMF